MRSAGNRGFTLIEVLASVVMLAVGIVGSMQAIGAMSAGDGRARELERMQRLAVDKYRELLVTDDSARTSSNGDFTDRNDQVHLWAVTYDDSGIDNLDLMTVTVTNKNSPNGRSAKVESLVYVPSSSSTSSSSSSSGSTSGGTTGG